MYFPFSQVIVGLRKLNIAVKEPFTLKTILKSVNVDSFD